MKKTNAAPHAPPTMIEGNRLNQVEVPETGAINSKKR